MPLYLIRNNDEMPKYAKIDPKGKKITWTEQGDSTGYISPQAAKEAFKATCSAMIESAQQKADKALAEGRVVKHSNGKFVYQSNLDLALAKDSRSGAGSTFYSKNCSGEATALELFCLRWLYHQHTGTYTFNVSSRASSEDLLSVFETYYIRVDGLDDKPVWLGRPQRKNQSGLVQVDSFSLATGFSSLEAAKAELIRNGQHGNIIKTSCVFTDVHTVGKPEPDDVSSSIRSACESRDIEAVINEGARARLADMKKHGGIEPAAEPKKPRARL